MKILIDARMYGLEHGGIGRYVMNLVEQLKLADVVNDYILLVNNLQFKISEIENSLKISNFKLKILTPSVKHYSLREQVELPRLLNRLDFDIAHFPHFNVPLSFNRPFVVTIHDLIKHTSTGMKTTTRIPILYWAKYLGYKKVFNHAVKGSRKIIVPSHAVKADLLINYDIPDDKVVVTYEGVDKIFNEELKVKSQKLILDKHKVQIPYIIYTGSVYPHKNVERLIQAASRLELNLVIVGSRNVFSKRIEDFAKKYSAGKFVNFLGFVSDKDLAVLYKNAKAFVFPSLSEGFGLPGVEAMVAGCPVVCSDIPVFHEIYKDAAMYFNPENVEDMAMVIKEVYDMRETERKRIIAKGKDQSEKFSWKKMAEETLRVYVDAL